MIGEDELIELVSPIEFGEVEGAASFGTIIAVWLLLLLPWPCKGMVVIRFPLGMIVHVCL